MLVRGATGEKAVLIARPGRMSFCCIKTHTDSLDSIIMNNDWLSPSCQSKEVGGNIETRESHNDSCNNDIIFADYMQELSAPLSETPTTTRTSPDTDGEGTGGVCMDECCDFMMGVSRVTNILTIVPASAWRILFKSCNACHYNSRRTPAISWTLSPVM